MKFPQFWRRPWVVMIFIPYRGWRIHSRYWSYNWAHLSAVMIGEEEESNVMIVHRAAIERMMYR